MPEVLEAPPQEAAAPNEAMAELLALDEPAVESKEAAPEKAAAKKPEAAPKTEVKPPVAEKKAETKPAEQPEKPVKEAVAKETKPATEAPQEKNFAALRDRAGRFETEANQLKGRIKELETKLSTAGIPKEFEEKLTARETENRELRERLAQQDFTTSEDFQANYYKPYVSTWTRGIQDAMGLTYTDEASGVSKTVSKEDAEYLLSLPAAKMLQEAKRVFGEDENARILLVSHKQRIQESYERMNEAKTNAKKLTEAKAEKEGLDRAEQSNRIKGLWQTENESYQKTNPIFQESEDDAEGTETLKTGLAEADKAFSADTKPEERLAIHAKMRFHHAAHPRLVAQAKAKDERIAELEKELEAFQESEPDTKGSANGTVHESKSSLEELRELERGAA